MTSGAQVSSEQIARDLSTLFSRVLAASDLLKALDEVELSIGQFKTLAMLGDTREEMSLKEVAEAMSLSLPAASRAVDGLVSREYVERREDEVDRRVKRVRIAPAGAAVMERVIAVRIEVLTRWLDTLPEHDRERLHKAISPILDRSEDPPMTQRMRLNEGNRRWWTLFAMCFALFMIMLDNTVVNVALPSIQRDLGTSLSSLEWTINAYTLTFGVLLVTGGRLGDIFGRRRMFLFGVIVFAISSALIGLAPTDTWLVGGRAIQGIGAAFMMPATLSIITNAFPPEERGKAIGTWAGVSAIALAIGPLLGGFLVEHVTWRAIFYINIPVAALAVAVTLFAAHESRDGDVDHEDRPPRDVLDEEPAEHRPDRQRDRADPGPRADRLAALLAAGTRW